MHEVTCDGVCITQTAWYWKEEAVPDILPHGREIAKVAWTLPRGAKAGKCFLKLRYIRREHRDSRRLGQTGIR